MHRTSILPLALLALAAACDGMPASGAGLDAAEAEAVAVELDAAATGLVDGDFAGRGPSADRVPADAPSAATGTATSTFRYARPCPEGGRVTLAGETAAAWDTETRTRSAETAATKTHEACSLRGRRDRTITLTGAPALALTARRAMRAGVLDGVQTTTMAGAVAWMNSAGGAGTCEIRLAGSFDPASRTHRVEGTVCGRAIDRTRIRTD